MVLCTDSCCIGGILDLEGKSGRVMVRLGNQQFEAQTTRCRFWVDFHMSVMLSDHKQIDHSLMVTVDLPDGEYAVRPDPERDSKVRKVDRN